MIFTKKGGVFRTRFQFSDNQLNPNSPILHLSQGTFFSPSDFPYASEYANSLRSFLSLFTSHPFLYPPLPLRLLKIYEEYGGASSGTALASHFHSRLSATNSLFMAEIMVSFRATARPSIPSIPNLAK